MKIFSVTQQLKERTMNKGLSVVDLVSHWPNESHSPVTTHSTSAWSRTAVILLKLLAWDRDHLLTLVKTQQYL